MSRRISITTTATAWIEEVWDLEVPDDFPEVTLERVEDPDDPIDLESLLQDSRVTFVAVTDRTLGNEEDREVRSVTEVQHEPAVHPEHTECADGCGLNVTHDGACLDKPGGRQVCEHEPDSQQEAS